MMNRHNKEVNGMMGSFFRGVITMALHRLVTLVPFLAVKAKENTAPENKKNQRFFFFALL